MNFLDARFETALLPDMRLASEWWTEWVCIALRYETASLRESRQISDD